MEIALAESLIIAPPILVMGLFALYRNNILCFWDCNPVGVATKDFVKDVSVRMSDVSKLALNVALTIRNYTTAIQSKIEYSTALVANVIKSTALMIVNTIQGILTTINQNIHLVISHMRGFLHSILASLQDYLGYLKNTTVALFTPKVVSSDARPWILAVGFVAVLVILWLTHMYLSKTEPKKTEEMSIETDQEIKPKKNPVRRRTKKTDA